METLEQSSREVPSATEPGARVGGSVTAVPEPGADRPRPHRALAARAAALFLFGVALVLAGVAGSQQPSVQIVAHPGVATVGIGKKDLSRIFLKQRTAWPDGSAAVVVDQPAAADVREAFSLEVLGKSVNAVESYWHGQVFAGKANPPTVLASDAEVLEFVRRTPGAVGYVASGTSTPGVKLLQVTP